MYESEMPEKPWSDLSRHEERSQSGCDHQQEIDPAKQLVRGRAFSPQQQVLISVQNFPD